VNKKPPPILPEGRRKESYWRGDSESEKDLCVKK